MFRFKVSHTAERYLSVTSFYHKACIVTPSLFVSPIVNVRIVTFELSSLSIVVPANMNIDLNSNEFVAAYLNIRLESFSQKE